MWPRSMLVTASLARSPRSARCRPCRRRRPSRARCRGRERPRRRCPVSPPRCRAWPAERRAEHVGRVNRNHRDDRGGTSGAVGVPDRARGPDRASPPRVVPRSRRSDRRARGADQRHHGLGERGLAAGRFDLGHRVGRLAGGCSAAGSACGASRSERSEQDVGDHRADQRARRTGVDEDPDHLVAQAVRHDRAGEREQTARRPRRAYGARRSSSNFPHLRGDCAPKVRPQATGNSSVLRWWSSRGPTGLVRPKSAGQRRSQGD